MAQKITKDQILKMSDQIFIFSPEQLDEIKGHILKVDEDNEKVLWQIGKELEATLEYQDEILTKIIENNPEFPQELKSKLDAVYTAATDEITAREREEAESLLQFDDV